MIIIDNNYCLQCFQKIVEQLMKPISFSKFVLMFHDITCDQIDTTYADYSITIGSFEKMICELQNRGKPIVNIDEFIDSKTRSGILISFDDAFEGVYKWAFPFLKSRELPFVVFQTINQLDTEGKLSSDMIRSMLEYTGCELGAHGISHRNLSQLNRHSTTCEISMPKMELESKFKTSIRSMAYPYGSFDTVGLREKMIAGKVYDVAFGTLQTGYMNRMLPRSYIPRINVNEYNYNDIINRICR